MRIRGQRPLYAEIKNLFWSSMTEFNFPLPNLSLTRCWCEAKFGSGFVEQTTTDVVIDKTRPIGKIKNRRVRRNQGPRKPITSYLYICLTPSEIPRPTYCRNSSVGTRPLLPGGSREDRYLVDPASSHMLVSKIKPCMSKYKHVCTVKLQMAHYNSYSLFDIEPLLG